MGLSVYNIKKWYKMLTGNSIMHVNQDMGKCFVPGKLEGYFNNMTEKVTKDPETLEKKTIPMTTDEVAGVVYFPVAIFQYGLGAFDLYLMTKEEKYISQFWNCVEFAVGNQEESGAWNNFGFVYPEAPYGSMCQGEGASLLLRAYKVTGEKQYLERAQKAIEFMLKPLEQGGTSKYEGEDVLFCEFTNKPIVLNGWIFSLYGLYDLTLVDRNEKYKTALDTAVKSLVKHLGDFDNGYWSMYDMKGKITSPFYHNLHIAQLEALHLTFGNAQFKETQEKYESYKNKQINRNRAFIKKVVQKIAD